MKWLRLLKEPAFWISGPMHGVHRGPDLRCALGGIRQMRLFGDLLPFVGWRYIDVDNDGQPCEERSHWFAEAFEVEWFGHGAIPLHRKGVPE